MNIKDSEIDHNKSDEEIIETIKNIQLENISVPSLNLNEEEDIDPITSQYMRLSGLGNIENEEESGMLVKQMKIPKCY